MQEEHGVKNITEDSRQCSNKSGDILGKALKEIESAVDNSKLVEDLDLFSLIEEGLAESK